MKRLLLVLLGLTASAAALAESSSHWRKAETLVRVSGASELVAQLLPQMELELEQTTDNLYQGLTEEYFMPPEISENIDEFEAEARKVLHQMFSVDRIVEEMVPMYMSYFSEDELDQLIDFYTSPIGKTLVEKQPTIVIHSAELGQQRLQAYLDAIAPLQHKLEKDLGLYQ